MFDETIHHHGLRYSSVHFDDLSCRVMMDWDDDTITLMQPYHLGGRIVTTMEEYNEFEGNIKTFARFKQAQFREDVTPVVEEWKRRHPDRPFDYYPNDIALIWKQLGDGHLTREQIADGWRVSVKDDGSPHYVYRWIYSRNHNCIQEAILDGEGWIYRTALGREDTLADFDGPVLTLQEAVAQLEVSGDAQIWKEWKSTKETA